MSKSAGKNNSQYFFENLNVGFVFTSKNIHKEAGISKYDCKTQKGIAFVELLYCEALPQENNKVIVITKTSILIEKLDNLFVVFFVTSPKNKRNPCIEATSNIVSFILFIEFLLKLPL